MLISRKRQIDCLHGLLLLHAVHAGHGGLFLCKGSLAGPDRDSAARLSPGAEPAEADHTAHHRRGRGEVRGGCGEEY